MNGATLFGLAATGVIHNSASVKPADDQQCWDECMAEAKAQGFSGHAVWPVAQQLFQAKADKPVANSVQMPQEQPENGGSGTLTMLNSGTSEGVAKGWVTRKGGDAEHGEEQHESGHDFNWMKSHGSGEQGEVFGTLLHKGKPIDGSSGWYRTNDPKVAAQTAMEGYGVKEPVKPSGGYKISENQNVVGAYNVLHDEHGLSGFVKPRSNGKWTAHNANGDNIDSTFHDSKEQAANVVAHNVESKKITNSAGKSVLTHGLEPILNTWSDEARKAAIEARKAKAANHAEAQEGSRKMQEHYGKTYATTKDMEAESWNHTDGSTAHIPAGTPLTIHHAYDGEHTTVGLGEDSGKDENGFAKGAKSLPAHDSTGKETGKAYRFVVPNEQLGDAVGKQFPKRTGDFVGDLIRHEKGEMGEREGAAFRKTLPAGLKSKPGVI